MDLVRTPLLLERTRPAISVTGRHNPRTPQGRRREHSQRKEIHRKPKSRTRRISTRRQLGTTRRDTYARIERRMRVGATPQTNEVLRSVAKLKYVRRKGERPLLRGRPAPRNALLKGLTRR